MHRAVRRGLPELVELLLDKGVDCHPPPAAGTDHNRNRSGNVSAMLLVTLLMGEQKFDTGGHLDIDDVSRPLLEQLHERVERAYVLLHPSHLPRVP